MRAETRNLRMRAIETAAIEQLKEAGYEGMSMLSVARRAKASNETLYRWYGDKKGLFKALVARNADLIRQSLEASLTAEETPVEALRAFGPHLLRVLTGPTAIALNRAAAADTSGELGEALAEAGRSSVLPLLTGLMEDARGSGFAGLPDPENAADLYLSLLVGDLQIRLVTGALDGLSAQEIDARADRAWRFMQMLS